MRPKWADISPQYRYAWGDMTSETGYHTETLCAAVIVAAHADDEEEYLGIIGLRDPDAVEDINDLDHPPAIFRRRFQSIRYLMTLDEYEHELRAMYRRFGGTAAEFLANFDRQPGLRAA